LIGVTSFIEEIKMTAPVGGIVRVHRAVTEVGLPAVPNRLPGPAFVSKSAVKGGRNMNTKDDSHSDMTSKRRGFLTMAAAAVVAATSMFDRIFGIGQAAAQTKPDTGASTAWRMRGDTFEACSCNVTCPCNLGSDPTLGFCEVINVWRIQEGHYGNIRLDGLNVVLYIRMPGNPLQGNWTTGLYLDQRATPQQVEVLGIIFSGKAGSIFAAERVLIGTQLPPKQVPIDFQTVNGEHRVTVPGLLEVGTERIPNPIPGQPPIDTTMSDIAFPLYAGPVHVRRSTVLKLTDPSMSFAYAGRSSLTGQFEYSGP
jgi:hypothetical protein